MLAHRVAPAPAYHLFIESEASDTGLERIAHDIEEELLRGSRTLRAGSRPLGPVGRCGCADGQLRYEARCIQLGQRAGNIKPADLHLEPGWTEHLACAGDSIGSIATG
jgi:hypothetical protein